MKKILIFLLLALAFPALAQRVTLTVTVTNRAVTTNGLTIGSAFRYFTNAQSSTTFATNLTSINATKTNLFNQIAAFPYTAITLQDVGTNSFRLVSSASSLASALTGTWGYVSTNSTVGPSNSVPMIYPFSTILGTTNQTNQGSAIVDGLSNYTTNSVITNAISLGNYLTKGASTQQVVIAPVQFNGVLRAASALHATNGFTSALTNINPVTSNLVNYGNAIRSEGSGGNSFQIGSNANANGVRSMAIGNSSYGAGDDGMASGNSATNATNYGTAVGNLSWTRGVQSVAVGYMSRATNYSVSVGSGAQALGEQSTAIGADTLAYDFGLALGDSAEATAYSAIGIRGTASAVNAMAIGGVSAYSNSAAIGPPDHSGTLVSTTTTNQVRLGTANHTVSIPGQLLVSGTQSNTTFRGTNIAGGSWSYPRFDLTTLAAGNNLAVPIGTNRFVRAGAGPASAATIVGMVGGATTGGLDGQDVVIFNDTAYTLTFAVNSVDPVPANRINTPTASDISIPDQGWAQFFYDGTDARWKMLNAFSGTNFLVTTTTTNAIYAVMTNGVLVSGAATNLNLIGHTNIIMRATNTSGQVDILIAASASGGGGVDGSANSNLTYAVGANVTNHVNNATTALTNALLGKVDELNGVATNLTIYTGSPGLTIWQLPGAATNSWQVMRTNGGFPIAFVSSNDVLNASNVYFRGKFTNVAPVHLESFLYVTGAQTNNSGITIENDAGLTIATGAGVITHSGWNGSRAVVSSVAKELAESATTSTEIGYLSGVTSALQTQLAGKVDENSGVATNLAAYGTLSFPGTVSTHIKAAATNNVTITNILGLIHVTAASVLAFDFNSGNEYVQTNRSSAAQSIILTNAADGQTMSGILLGEVSGGTSRAMTFIPNTGQLIQQVGDYTTGLATSLAITLTNGLSYEWSTKVRRVNGTNIHHFAGAYYKH